MTPTDPGRTRRPVRIEMATSEIEGGSCRAWADPAQVLAGVARSSPEDTFARFVQPKLEDLEDPCASAKVPAASPASEDELPPLVRSVLERLQSVHSGLFRENRLSGNAPRRSEVTCAFAEEERVYFVKGPSAWMFLIRDGRAWPAAPPGRDGSDGGQTLGRAERLQLEVTSLPVLPGDTVVLLALATEVAPDLRAVSALFDGTSDLKRACDGLVNLIGPQSQSASVASLRFVPVPAHDTGSRENPLLGLGLQCEAEASEPLDAAIARAVEQAFEPESELPGLVPGFASEGSAGAGEENWLVPDSGFPFPWEIESGQPARSAEPEAVPPPAPRPAEEEQVAESEEDEELAAVGIAASESKGPAGPETPSSETIDEPASASTPALRAGPKMGALWFAAIGVIVLAMALLASIPHGGGIGAVSGLWGHLFAGGSQGQSLGSLEIDPTPPAQRVILDGQVAASGTPARLDSLPAGEHSIGLDLGPCGVWETTVRVRRGETGHLAPRLTGSVQVEGAVAPGDGRVWVQGREKVPLPATLDSLPAGWVRIFYEDSRVPLWDRQVLVRPGQKTRVVLPGHFSSDQGRVQVEAITYRGSDGMTESRGDSVWIDGSFAGRSPLELSLPPGLHGFRVGSRGAGGYGEVCTLFAGGCRHVLAQLGGPATPVLKHLAPGRVLVRGPVLLTVDIDVPGDGQVERPTLHLPLLGPGSRELPLTPIDEDQHVYVCAVDPGLLQSGRPVAYYFTMIGPEGEIHYSDLYTLIPQASWSPRAEAASAGWAGRRAASAQLPDASSGNQ